MPLSQARITRQEGVIARYELGINTKESIHFTVRSLLAKRYAPCPVLKSTRTIPTKFDNPIVLWDLQKLWMPKHTRWLKDDSGKLPPGPWKSKTIPEDFASDEELYLLRLWLEKWKEALIRISTTAVSEKIIPAVVNVGVNAKAEAGSVQESLAALEDTKDLLPSRLIPYLTQARAPTLMYPAKD
jgi:hypothetical protein